jgi:hypothetical protein
MIAAVIAAAITTAVMTTSSSRSGLNPKRANYPVLIGCLMKMDSYDFSNTCRAIDEAPNRTEAVLAACVASLGQFEEEHAKTHCKEMAHNGLLHALLELEEWAGKVRLNQKSKPLKPDRWVIERYAKLWPKS